MGLSNRTAIVRDVASLSQVEVLPGKGGAPLEENIFGVAMNSKYIVTATGRYSECGGGGKLAGKGNVYIWSADDFQLVCKIDHSQAKNVSFRPTILDDHIITASRDRWLDVFDISTQRKVETVPLAFQARAVAVDSNGRIAVSGSHAGAVVFKSPFFLHNADAAGSPSVPKPTAPHRIDAPRVHNIFRVQGVQTSAFLIILYRQVLLRESLHLQDLLYR